MPIVDKSVSNEIVTVNISVLYLRWIGIAVLALLVLIIFLRFLKRFRSVEKGEKIKKLIQKKGKKRKADPQLFVTELHETLITEMRGTSKQNWIMIVLTVIFITSSVFSSVILRFIQNIPSIVSPWINSIMSLIGK